MKDIDNLIEKYFDGVTSTEEEKKLKQYFEGNELLPEHAIYKPLFIVFNEEKQIKAPLLVFPEKQKLKRSYTRRIIALLVTSAAIAFLIITLTNLHVNTTHKHPEYVVIMNGKKVLNRSEAQQYAEEMFKKTEMVVECTYQPLREISDIKNNLNAERILRETDQEITTIKSNYRQ